LRGGKERNGSLGGGGRGKKERSRKAQKGSACRVSEGGKEEEVADCLFVIGSSLGGKGRSRVDRRGAGREGEGKKRAPFSILTGRGGGGGERKRKKESLSNPEKGGGKKKALHPRGGKRGVRFREKPLSSSRPRGKDYTLKKEEKKKAKRRTTNGFFATRCGGGRKGGGTARTDLAVLFAFEAGGGATLREGGRHLSIKRTKGKRGRRGGRIIFPRLMRKEKGEKRPEEKRGIGRIGSHYQKKKRKGGRRMTTSREKKEKKVERKGGAVDLHSQEGKGGASIRKELASSSYDR